jgi:hypothetical protein
MNAAKLRVPPQSPLKPGTRLTGPDANDGYGGCKRVSSKQLAVSP